MIAIVNYGSGNIRAISNIYERFEVPHLVAECASDLEAADRIVLPGVGAFDQVMIELNRSGLRSALDEMVTVRRKPVIGICVGMQILANASEEGEVPGLGWIGGTVSRFDSRAVRECGGLPHMGWNTVRPSRDSSLFEGVDLELGFYFLHSYFFRCSLAEDSLGETDYGSAFTSVVQRNNVWGVQFHPEKSHQAGMQVLMNFATRCT